MKLFFVRLPPPSNYYTDLSSRSGKPNALGGAQKSSRSVKLNVPERAQKRGQLRTKWSTICSGAPHSMVAVKAEPHLLIVERERPIPLRIFFKNFKLGCKWWFVITRLSLNSFLVINFLLTNSVYVKITSLPAASVHVHVAMKSVARIIETVSLVAVTKRYLIFPKFKNAP